jgi:hypothetical protein
VLWFQPFVPLDGKVGIIDRIQWRFRCKAKPLQQSIPRLGCISNRPPHRFPQDSNFTKWAWNAPCTNCPGGKESNIPCAEPDFLTVWFDQKSLAGDNNDRFVLLVMPLETSRGAFPDNNLRDSITTVRHFLIPCLRSTGNDPLRRDGRWREFYASCCGHYNRLRHNVLPIDLQQSNYGSADRFRAKVLYASDEMTGKAAISPLRDCT